MKNKGTKYNHLWHMENTEENRNLIKILNKSMKEQNSLYKLRLKYRKPKPGHKYGWGGSLKRDNALAFAVYMSGSAVCDAERYNINKQNRILSIRNTSYPITANIITSFDVKKQHSLSLTFNIGYSLS